MSDEEGSVAVGDLLDSMEVRARIGEGDLVSSALVIMCVVDDEGSERISVAWSADLSWVTRTGMLHHALADETKPGGDE